MYLPWEVVFPCDWFYKSVGRVSVKLHYLIWKVNSHWEGFMHLATGTCIYCPDCCSGNGITSQMLYQYNRDLDARCGNKTGVDSATKENWNLTPLFPYL